MQSFLNRQETRLPVLHVHQVIERIKRQVNLLMFLYIAYLRHQSQKTDSREVFSFHQLLKASLKSIAIHIVLFFSLTYLN